MQKSVAPNPIINPLLTDLYEITMAYAYFKQARHEEEAVFECFFRKCPFGGQYAIAGGLESVIEFLERFRITEDQIEYLRTILPRDADARFFEWLRTLDCSKLHVSAVQEGDIVFPRIPLLTLTGPLGLVQMLETPVLNLVNFPTLVATNASRMVTLSGRTKCVEFGLRRAQGPDGGMSATKYSYLGGFVGTSNVLAGMHYGIPVSGTMAHSFVTSYNSLNEVHEFEIGGVRVKETAIAARDKLKDALGIVGNEGELAAFLAFAQAFEDAFLCLVDTYDTLKSGIPNFLSVAYALAQGGKKALGIRLDSGDLAQLSIEARKIFKAANEQLGMESSEWRIVASNDINEESIKQLNEKNHQIDVFGIGTNLVTCQKQPALGGVYKLVETRGSARLKLSQEAEKATLPGKKRVYRLFKGGKAFGDVIALPDEQLAPGADLSLVSFAKRADGAANHRADDIQEVHRNVWDENKRTEFVRTLKDAREFSQNQAKYFEESVLAVNQPTRYEVYLTQRYDEFFKKLQKDAESSFESRK